MTDEKPKPKIGKLKLSVDGAIALKGCLSKVNWPLVIQGVALIAKGLQGTSLASSDAIANTDNNRIPKENVPSPELVFVDIETTGLSSQRDEIVEIAAIRFNLISDESSTFHSLIKPTQKIPYRARLVHGISDQMVARAPPIRDVMPEFREFLSSSAIVAYNASFDVGFLKANAAKLRIPFDVKYICALQLARSKLLGLPNYRLETVARYLEIEQSSAHRALVDCEVGIEIFRRLAQLEL